MYEEKWADCYFDALPDAKGITWDGCHKIYILLDDEQVAQSTDWGYEVIPVEQTIEGRKSALATLKEWYADSCGLRFITAVGTENGVGVYEDVIEQGFDWRDEEED
jgi:hypothetical protein